MTNDVVEEVYYLLKKKSVEELKEAIEHCVENHSSSTNVDYYAMRDVLRDMIKAKESMIRRKEARKKGFIR